ncbi:MULTISPECIES: hypothetical protein [Cyanophyceae]|nr:MULTISPECIES: hypothetical protein [Cyanophyceae]
MGVTPKKPWRSPNLILIPSAQYLGHGYLTHWRSPPKILLS